MRKALHLMLMFALSSVWADMQDPWIAVNKCFYNTKTISASQPVSVCVGMIGHVVNET